jgi:hypothetical protein
MTVPTGSGRQLTVERVLAVASAVLLPLGLAVIVLGWYGAAHTPYLFEQLPYLISGGLLGLGLAIVGGLIYFASWVARTSAQQQQQGDEVVELLRDVLDELRAATPAPTTRRKGSGGNGAAPYVATARGGMLHRPDCAVVAGRSDLRSISASGDGLKPCTLCHPFDADVLTH